MPHIQLYNQLARAILCLNGSGSLKDRLIFAALTLNEINTTSFPYTSIATKYVLILKALGVKGEVFSEEEIVGAVSCLTEQQQQELCAAIIAMHGEIGKGEVFN